MITNFLGIAPFARVEPGDWDWTALGTIATAVAAVVTAATIIFVARQTSATRKAAEEAERSADAANKALQHSQTQLDYAHQQHQQSLYMAIEAIKSRIDADMPRLVIEEAIVFPEVTLEDGSPLPPVFSDPKDRHQVIKHGFRFSIRNDGPRTAKLRFSQPVRYSLKLAGGTESIRQHVATKESVAVGVGEALIGEFHLTRSVGYWMDVSEPRISGQQLEPRPQFSIRYLTDADTGAHENHTMTLAGSALVRDQQEIGRWHHLPPEMMNGEGSELGVFLEPVRRMYFISRVRNEPLPELLWEDVSRTPSSVDHA